MLKIIFSKYQIVLVFVIGILIVSAYFLFLAHDFTLVTADLGRHIQNGKIFFEKGQIVSDNYYSYTYPRFETVNHHWLSGTVFYMIWSVADFIGLHVFFVALSVITLLIFFGLAMKKGGVFSAVATAVLVMTLVAERTEIRPEVFSYFFAAIYFWLLISFRKGHLPWKWLLIFLPLQAVWVNLHIYFFLGLVLVGVFFIDSLVISGWKDKKTRILFWVGAGITFSSLINPWFVSGALQPFNIFREYGYRLVENQSVWFLDRVLPQANLQIFKVVFLFVLISLVIKFLKKGWRWHLAETVLLLGMSAAAWFQLRNFTVFGLFALPLVAENFSLISFFKTRNSLKVAAAVIAAVYLLLVYSGEFKTVYQYRTDFGIGMINGDDSAARFVRDHNLHGPIFNNYDIGGYLIFHLYPDYSVYVDNRPEAYPLSFFQKDYIPMNEDKVWDRLLRENGFNLIIFSYRDFTPWAQEFLRKRSVDPMWKQIFTDDRVIIFEKISS